MPADPAGSAPYAIGRGTALGVGLLLAMLVAWAAGSGWYLLHRDDFAAGLLSRQAAMQQAYEDRIAGLRSRLDRVASQKLIEQDSMEGRLEQLVTRQVQIETRQAMISSLAEQAGGAGARPPSALDGAMPDLPAAARAFAPATRPLPESLPKLRGSSLERALDPRTRDALSSIERMAAVERSIGVTEAAQLRALDVLDRRAGDEVRRLRAAIAQTGLNPDGLAAPDAGAGTGGPLVPLSVDPGAGPFEASVDRVQSSLVLLDRLRRNAQVLPFGRPVPGELDQSSGYGVRIDPFTRGPAMHTGLDFRAEPGTRVTAAGAGRVVSAEHAGGYGNMVEIDHGNGVTSRYAHLSAMLVSVGQRVAAGQAIGRVGSTGRSTGPHLHYETRIGGDAVDPQRFLRAGSKLASLRDGVASR